MRTLTSLRTDHAFILYEQRDPAADLSDIRLLNSWPGGGIVLITSRELTERERREYLRAGVNSAIAGDMPRKDFLRMLQFMGDYAFTHKPVAQNSPEVQIFRMPLWKRTFDIAASLSAILLLSPLLIVVAAAIKLDSPGPVVYKSKRVGSNYRIFDFLKFRSMRTDADRRLKELGELNQYAAQPQEADSGKMVLGEEEMRRLLEDTQNGMLYADDFVIAEETHHHKVEIPRYRPLSVMPGLRCRSSRHPALYVIDNDLCGKCPADCPVRICCLNGFFHTTDICDTAVIKRCTKAYDKDFIISRYYPDLTDTSFGKPSPGILTAENPHSRIFHRKKHSASSVHLSACPMLLLATPLVCIVLSLLQPNEIASAIRN